jgi:glucose-fructose oxidoreductase
MKNAFVSAFPLLLAICFCPMTARSADSSPPIRVAIVGLVHGHVAGFLGQLKQHPEVALVGIAEPDQLLWKKYGDQNQLPSNLFYPTESEMIAATNPQAILVYTSVADHRAAIELAASHHIAVMVEKPLCTTVEDALAIQAISEKFHVPVLVNYETTWYASNRAAADLLASGRMGDARKLVIHDGHQGPKELGVPPEFLSWLTDPHKNGAGALFDFGCYGVDLATVLMNGALPETVTAVTQQIKPQIYPHVDDEATIILTYPRAQAIIQASWNWPFSRKDMEVYGATGYAITVGPDHLRTRLPDEKDETLQAATPIAAPQDDSLHYLVAVLQHQYDPGTDFTSLKTNVTVMRILDAARRSAASGKTVRF